MLSREKEPIWVTVCGIYRKIDSPKNFYMSLDVDIYMNNILKFFKDNPKELYNLVPKQKENEFFEKIREVALSNEKKGDEVALTQKQLINICRSINTQTNVQQLAEKIMVYTPFGSYSLN